MFAAALASQFGKPPDELAFGAVDALLTAARGETDRDFSVVQALVIQWITDPPKAERARIGLACLWVSHARGPAR